MVKSWVTLGTTVSSSPHLSRAQHVPTSLSPVLSIEDSVYGLMGQKLKQEKIFETGPAASYWENESQTVSLDPVVAGISQLSSPAYFTIQECRPSASTTTTANISQHTARWEAAPLCWSDTIIVYIPGKNSCQQSYKSQPI